MRFSTYLLASVLRDLAVVVTAPVWVPVAFLAWLGYTILVEPTIGYIDAVRRDYDRRD